MNQPRSENKININENIIFSKFAEILKQYDFQDERMTDIYKDIVIDLLKQKELENNENLIDYDLEIKKIENKQENLLDMKLDWKINDEIFLNKNNKFENNIKQLQEDKTKIKNDDFEEKTQVLFELAKNLYTSYNRVNNKVKTDIMRNLLFELFVDTKKELTYRETPVFKSLKTLKILYGTPGRIWTHDKPRSAAWCSSNWATGA